MPPILQRPADDEYAPWAGDYVRRVGDGDILDILTGQPDELAGVLGGLSDQQALFRFGPNEWSIKEVVGHLGDFERIIFYRALCISRNERAPLPGFDQDDYVRATSFDERSLAELLDEFRLVRQANLLTIKRFSGAVGLRRGTASGSEFTVRALVYMLAGHVYHHLEALQTHYLPAS